MPDEDSTSISAADVNNAIKKGKSNVALLNYEATALYSQKKYREAAEVYSRATELQAKENGEMDTQNADILYFYGRCLYHVAVEKSDVLGEKVAGERPKEKNSKKKQADGGESGPSQEQRITEEGVAAIASGKTEEKEEEKPTVTKPFFQFTGDENFDASDDEEEVADGGEDQEEEEDEFMNAYEILDLARVLFRKRLDELEANEEKDDDPELSFMSKSMVLGRIRERLADTHDLQAEISLEGEQFLAAADDFRAALALREQIYPPHSSYLAEIHYKLSLALEFGSVTQPKDPNGEIDQSQVSTVDEEMRSEAAKEMEAAISCCKQRIAKEQADLGEKKELIPPGPAPKITQKSIDEVKEMVVDMEQRLVELRQPPVSINDPRGTGTLDGATPLSGILGAMLGESSEQQKKRLEEATKEAKDITGLVRKKKPAATADGGSSSNAESSKGANGTANGTAEESEVKSGTKRRVEFAEDVVELGTGKKARVEDTGDDE